MLMKYLDSYDFLFEIGRFNLIHLIIHDQMSMIKPRGFIKLLWIFFLLFEKKKIVSKKL